MTLYNLNIESYTFDEILELFNISSRNISESDIKSAKKKVLAIHPDKSRLSSEYFIFYKQAYTILTEFYSENNKINVVVSNDPIEYKTDNSDTGCNNTRDIINKIPRKDFNALFNTLFDREMISKNVSDKNEWFKSSETDIKYPIMEKTNIKEMNSNFEQIREKSNGLTRYTGNVRDIKQFSGTHCANIHGNDDDDEYVCSNVFSKLKYDDLRKVHKDETIFVVSERDFNNDNNRYRNTKDYDNDEKDFIIMKKEDSESFIKSKDDIWRKSMLNKEFIMKSRIREYEVKNKSVLAAFLHLTDK